MPSKLLGSYSRVAKLKYGDSASLEAFSPLSPPCCESRSKGFRKCQHDCRQICGYISFIMRVAFSLSSQVGNYKENTHLKLDIEECTGVENCKKGFGKFSFWISEMPSIMNYVYSTLWLSSIFQLYYLLLSSSEHCDHPGQQLEVSIKGMINQSWI